MFKFLKEKFKETVEKFTKKAEETSEELPEEDVAEPIVESPPEKPAVKKTEKKLEKKKEPISQPKDDVSKSSPQQPANEELKSKKSPDVEDKKSEEPVKVTEDVAKKTDDKPLTEVTKDFPSKKETKDIEEPKINVEQIPDIPAEEKTKKDAVKVEPEKEPEQIDTKTDDVEKKEAEKEDEGSETVIDDKPKIGEEKPRLDEHKEPKEFKKPKIVSVEEPDKENDKPDLVNSEESEEESEEELEKESEEEPKIVEYKPFDGVQITYFVPGTTTDNEKNLASGWNQAELSLTGIDQSKQLPAKVDDSKFDVVFTSDFKRAVDSADYAFPEHERIKDIRLRECNYGDFNGKESSVVKEHMLERVEDPYTNGESYMQVEKRIAEFLNFLLESYKGKHVAIVAHQAPQLALDVLLKGKSWEQAIEGDWRKTESWQPGWDYVISQPVDVPDVETFKPKSFLSKLFGKKKEKVIEPVVEPEIVEPEEHSAVETEEVVVDSEKEISKLVKEKKSSLEKPVEDATKKKKTIFEKIKQHVVKFQLTDEAFDELFWDFELGMLENNVAVEVIEKIKTDLKEKLTSENVTRKGIEQVIMETLKTSLDDVLDVPTFDLIDKIKTKKPFVISMIGVNGSGKTTTLAKIIKMLQDNNLSVVVAASDTFRAAAIQQLEQHTNNLGVKLISQGYGADPAAVAFDAIKHANSKGIDVVLIDTAGRLQSNSNLMDELKKLIRVNKPDLNIFIGESITGNDCVEQAVAFNEAVGIDGIILSKADIDDKGGAAISVSYVTKKPILFLGVGQTYADLKPFNKIELLEGLFS